MTKLGEKFITKIRLKEYPPPKGIPLNTQMLIFKSVNLEDPHQSENLIAE